MPDRRRAVLRLTGAAFVAGAAAMAFTAHPAHADSGLGSGLGAFSARAVSPGMQFTYDYPGAQAHPEVEGEAPYALAQLQSGPQSYALSSVAWPGALAANAGTTAQLVNLPIPASVAPSLNEPIRAEARTGSGPPTVTNDSYQGVGMTATATDTGSSADTVVSGTSGPVPSSQSGQTESRSTTALTGTDGLTVSAYSMAQNVKLDGGVVRIQSVTSSATATSHPTGATATGSTTVTGMTIAGQPAYLDQSGLHLGQTGPGAPVNQVASSIAQQAVAQAGMKVAVSEPTGQTHGSSVTYDAGNVVFYFAPPHDTNGDTFTATFGGASVTATTSSGYGSGSQTSDTTVAAVVPTGPSDTSVTPGTGQAVATGSAPVAPPASLPPQVPSSAAPPTAVPTATGQAVTNAAFALPHGIPPAAPVLAIVGSGLFALGLRRLPDRVLEQTTTGCTIGEEP